MALDGPAHISPTHTHSNVFNLECEPSEYSLVTHCINDSRKAASKWFQMCSLHVAREKKTLSYCHFSRELTPWLHLDEIRKSYLDWSITHAGKKGIETSFLSSWMASWFSTLRLWFNIKMSQALNEMSNIIWLWIPKIYDCPWRKLDNSAFLCQMCIYLIMHFIKLVTPLRKTLCPWAKATVQSSLWESNLHRIWNPVLKCRYFQNLWTQVATAMTTNHTYFFLSASFHCL